MGRSRPSWLPIRAGVVIAFFILGWGRGAVGMVLDTDTDWDEVRELLIESYCLLAPKKLIALLDRPGEDQHPQPNTPR